MSGFDLERRGLLRLAALAILPPVAASAQHANAVTAPIQQFYNALLAIMKAGRTTPFTRRYDMLAPSLEQALNVPQILRTAVGFAWAASPPSQQSDLLTAFRHYTVATWVSNFDSYSGQRLQVSPSTRSVGLSQIVHTEIVKASGGSNVIDFVMRPVGSTWKAWDVLLDGDQPGGNAAIRLRFTAGARSASTHGQSGTKSHPPDGRHCADVADLAPMRRSFGGT